MKQSRSSRVTSERLAAGPPRGLGAAPALVEEALQNDGGAALLSGLVDALKDLRPIVQSRAARALKKIQAENPLLLEPFAKKLLRATLSCQDLRARWNLLIVCGNLRQRGTDRALAIDLMFDSLRSQSPLERTFAMHALVNFAADDEALLQRVKPIVLAALENRSPAMRARARKLLPKVVTSGKTPLHIR